MSDAGGNAASADSPGASKAHAPKDRNCPYCGQAFTSSSLGRHLDLYIKEKNPKPADGVHDVDAIRKMRSGITRRQPRGSLAARRDASTPGTPTGSTAARRSPDARNQSSVPKDGQFMVDQSPVYPWQQPTWEATGVINDIPSKNGDSSGGWDESTESNRQSGAQQQRNSSRMLQKQQLDARQKLTDAMDTARAAELALREILGSWRAAKQQIDMNSLPFDFDPLSLDFPALTLQCLQPPPTLFSSTPFPTSSSWSIQAPAKKQYDALAAFFQEEFKKWRHTCAAATTATHEDLSYPPLKNPSPIGDLRESVKKAEQVATNLEKQVNEHLQSTYAVWESLPAARQQELWILELARSVGRRQKDNEKLKQTQHALKQESINLQSQIDQLNRLQQPREFRLMPPATVPFDQAFVAHVLHQGLESGYTGGIGFNFNDRHADTVEVVQRAIERWKNVIVSSRSTGMSSQRPLEQTATTTQAAATSSSTASSGPNATPLAAAPSAATPAPSTSTQQSQQPVRQQSTSTNNGSSSDVRPATTAAASTTTANDEGSDEDADAEMEDDESFAPVNAAAAATTAKPVAQQSLQKLQIPRTRENAQRNNAQFAMNGAGSMNSGQRVNMGRPMANMNAGGIQQAQNQQRAQQPAKNDYGTAVQAMGNGDPMYMGEG
ncbi:hypothetical protein G7054_g4242 [Neopestalotiopsis clavispora]|nr:hypothetical protein G7054_g4242 [Neopestalotiopsis clavispora]